MNIKTKLPEAYLHKPDIDRFSEFISNSVKVMKVLYNKDYHPNIVKRTFTEKLTKYPEEGNMEYIKGLISLNNGAKSLIIAPTGSGKTFSIDAIFRQLNSRSDDKQLLCILCPNRVQNIQNENSDDYNFEALVAGVQLEENEQNVRQLSAVYDKVTNIASFKKEHPEYRLRIVIDECHNLISANIFREQAINAIMKLINDNIADSYTFITATYESMCCFPFDNIVLFEDKNYKPVFQSIDIRFAEEGSFENLVMDTALNETKPYIRLNKKESIKRIEKTLLNMGQKCYSVTSDDKSFTTNDDGSVTYDNIIFDHITNHDDLYNNDGEADTILATSLLDAGTNFTKYSPESTPVFAVFSPKLMNIDEIEQAFNRFRPQKDASGNTIQLDHAVIIHQIPPSNITRIRVMKPEENGNRTFITTISQSEFSYTDKTTSEDKKEGYFDGILTISGKCLSELEDGRYLLEFTLGNDSVPMPVNLYVNIKPAMDIDAIGANLNLIQNSLRAWLDNENDLGSFNIFLDTASAIGNALNNDNAFFYNNGDETVSSKILIRPFAHFSALTDILERYMMKANNQLKQFHLYNAVDNAQTHTTFNDAPAATDTYINLPSFNVTPQCNFITVSNEDGEKVVTINCPDNGTIHFTNDQGKDIIMVKGNVSSLSVTVLGNKYPDSGALTETNEKDLKIIPAVSKDEAEKENWNFDKTNIVPIVITDTIHHCKIILQNNMGSIVGGRTQKEHLENLLNMFKTRDPDVANALYLTNLLELRINKQKLFNSVYSTYQSQYYYYPELLADELRRRLNVPVSISYYSPEMHEIEEIDEDREPLLEKLNILYQNPVMKDTLCNILHYGRSIPADLEDEQRKMIAEILQSRIYKKEYKSLQKLSGTLTFDYIVKTLNFTRSEKETNKHIKRLEYMLINQAIERNGTLPFSNKAMQMQFNEQKTLISIIQERKKSSGTKKFTINDSFMESLNKEFNEKMTASMPKYKPKSKTQFKNLLFYVYIIINQNSKSRKPELTEPILSVDDVPFK